MQVAEIALEDDQEGEEDDEFVRQTDAPHREVNGIWRVGFWASQGKPNVTPVENATQNVHLEHSVSPT